jgi:hypothetical protein
LLGVAVLALCAAVVEARAPRTAKRDYPQTARCPVHTGEAGPDDPFSFTATGRTVTITFLACDDRSPADPFDPTFGIATALDASIDDLIVVDRDVFNAAENHLAYPDAVPASYRLSEGCYQDTPVAWFFDRSKVAPFTEAMPFADDFETTTGRWTLGNATLEKEARDFRDDASGNRSLILARARRSADQRGDLCSFASVTVGGLVKDRAYVVDFSWWVGELNAGMVKNQPVLTVWLQDGPSGSLVPPRRPNQARVPAGVRKAAPKPAP